MTIAVSREIKEVGGRQPGTRSRAHGGADGRRPGTRNTVDADEVEDLPGVAARGRRQ